MTSSTTFGSAPSFAPKTAASALTGHLGARLPLGAHRLGPLVLHPFSLAYLAVGCGMVSKRLHIPKP